MPWQGSLIPGRYLGGLFRGINREVSHYSVDIAEPQPFYGSGSGESLFFPSSRNKSLGLCQVEGDAMLGGRDPPPTPDTYTPSVPLCSQRYLVPPLSEPFEDSALSTVLTELVTNCPSVSSIQNFAGVVVPVLVGLFYKNKQTKKQMKKQTVLSFVFRRE